jgi:hypothetical protein
LTCGKIINGKKNTFMFEGVEEVAVGGKFCYQCARLAQEIPQKDKSFCRRETSK